MDEGRTIHACCGTLQKGIANMKHLTSQSLSKLQDGVEEGLGQAEDDLKMQRRAFGNRETELKAEKRRTLLISLGQRVY